MQSKETFFWYDLETFGLNPSWDRIAQFAGQRTDMDLNPIGSPIILYCKLSADYLPDPAACLVTGITPQEVKEKGICESEFIEKINSEFSKPGTCTCGFNSIKFDDEFIRNALYRNFFDPYKREYEKNCSRWDIIDLVRATHDLRPSGIKWPPKNPKNGNPVFKLTSLTEANGIDQTGAHDAMVDVNATIAVASLIKKNAPRLFDYYFKLRKKSFAKNYLDPTKEKMRVHTNQIFTSPFGCTRLILPLSPAVNQNSSIICFDLSKAVEPLLNATSENIFSIDGIFNIGINKSPFIAPLTTLGVNDAKRLGIDKELCKTRAQQILKALPSITLKLRQNDFTPEFPEIIDPDFQIYSGGFFRDSDQKLFEIIRTTPQNDKLNLNLKFTDYRCQEMLWRHVCRNWPDTLSQEEMKKWKSFAAGRLLCPPGEVINNLDFVERKIDEKMSDNEIGPAQKSTLVQLKQYTKNLRKFLELPKK